MCEPWYEAAVRNVCRVDFCYLATFNALRVGQIRNLIQSALYPIYETGVRVRIQRKKRPMHSRIIAPNYGFCFRIMTPAHTYIRYRYTDSHGAALNRRLQVKSTWNYMIGKLRFCWRCTTQESVHCLTRVQHVEQSVETEKNRFCRSAPRC